MSGSALRQTPIHRALHRPQQILGGERELMLTSMLIAGGLIVAALNILATVIGVILWMICLYGLRKMAKADPVMSKVYIRQLKYNDFYGAYSRPWRVDNRARKI